MKVRPITLVAALVLLAALLAPAGCQSPPKNTENNNRTVVPINAQVAKPITTADEFLGQFGKWTSRLENIAAKTGQAYEELAGGKTDREGFQDQTRQIYTSMDQLNTDTDSREFQLSPEDRQKVHFEAVVKAYGKASKDVNDFLVASKHPEADQIKNSFQDLIKNKYPRDLAELKKLLNR